MRRALVIVTLALSLMGCGQIRGATREAKTVPPGEVSPDAWFSTTDPATGREFRCQLWWRKAGYAGGLASFCYEPEPAG